MSVSRPVDRSLQEFIELSDADVRQYNTAADAYYQDFANTDFETNKPFANCHEAAMISYQIGLLLAGSKIGRAQRILDFGAGDRSLSSMMPRLANEVFLLEVSPAALDMARETFQRDRRNALHAVGPHFDTYDGYDFAYPDEHFDRILCFDALHHVPNPRRVLNEMYRVLKPGGLAGFAESGRNHAKLPAIRDCVARTGILERSTRLDEIFALAQDAGFSNMTVKVFPAYTAWQVDYQVLTSAQDAGSLPIDASEVMRGFTDGNQSVFVLHKGPFCHDGTFPLEPAAEIRTASPRLEIAAGARAQIELRVTNTGKTRFNAAPHPLGGFVALGAHLFAQDRLVDFDYLHHPLPRDIDVGESSDVSVEIVAPADPGHYFLEWDIVVEGALWLGQVGSQTIRTELIVAAPA